ncbi:DUF5777 family beta-barrel protein [Aquimarina sp. SS2-1]|uniref:DUF5777 family beta-barrel protein n=1 Tax=Aquimarina besae TaxID=3342247 RepID=UPI00366EF294
MRNKNIILFVYLLLAGYCVQAQGLLDTLDKEYKDSVQYTSATFKSSRILLGHSVETRKSGVLEISAFNRFWNIPQTDSRSQSFIADKMSTRFGLDYAISDRLTLGVGGTTFDDIFDGYLKYRVIRQANKNGLPFSMTLFQNVSYLSTSRVRFGSLFLEENKDRFSYTTQMILASKITTNLSLQISPTFVHRGYSPSEDDPRNHFVLGFGGRYKVGNHISVASEYFYVTNPIESIDTYGAFSLGVNWEVGGLILQFYMTNARNIAEDAFLISTPNNFNFNDSNFNFGFNATYNIQLAKKKSE